MFVAVAEPAAAARESLALRLGSTGRRNRQITHIHAFIHTNVRMYIRTHIHLHTCQHMYTYAQSCLEWLRTTSGTYMDRCVYIYIHTHAHRRNHTNVLITPNRIQLFGLMMLSMMHGAYISCFGTTGVHASTTEGKYAQLNSRNRRKWTPHLLRTPPPSNFLHRLPRLCLKQLYPPGEGESAL